MTVWNVATAPFRLLDQFLGVVSCEGSWWLLPYEEELIDLASQGLSSENRIILANQMKFRFYVQRLHRRRITSIHYWSFPKVPRLVGLPDEYLLAKISAKSEAASTQVSIHVVAGILFELQFSKPPKPVFDERYMLRIISRGGKPDNRVMQAIHNSEHGDDDTL